MFRLSRVLNCNYKKIHTSTSPKKINIPIKHIPNKISGAMRLTQTPYMGKVKAVILDWSGTTADAFVIAPAVVFVEVFKQFGVPISMAEARKPMGLRKDLHIGEILQDRRVKTKWINVKGKEPCQQDVDEMFEQFVSMQVECLPKYTKLLPGITETVRSLQQKEIKIGSTTGFTKVMVDVLLKDAAAQGYIPCTSVAGDEVPNNMGFRPAPFMVYQNLLNLGVYPIQSVVKVDDTVSGVMEGVNAGCWAIGVANWSNYMNIDSMEQWENMSSEQKEQRINESKNKLIKESNAHYIIDDLTILPKVIEDIENRMSKGERP